MRKLLRGKKGFIGPLLGRLAVAARGAAGSAGKTLSRFGKGTSTVGQKVAVEGAAAAAGNAAVTATQNSKYDTLQQQIGKLRKHANEQFSQLGEKTQKGKEAAKQWATTYDAERNKQQWEWLKKHAGNARDFAEKHKGKVVAAGAGVAAGAAWAHGKAKKAAAATGKGVGGAAWARLTAKTTPLIMFFFISIIFHSVNVLTLQSSSFALRIVYIIALSLLGWALLYDGNPKAMSLCVMLAIIQTLVPYLIFVPFLDFPILQVFLLFAPLWTLHLLFTQKGSGFLTTIAVLVVLSGVTVVAMPLSNLVADSFGGSIPFPAFQKGQFDTAKANSVELLREAWDTSVTALIELPVRIKKGISDQIFYASHGYYPGTQEKDTFVGIRLRNPALANQLTYEPDIVKQPVQIAAKLEVFNKRARVNVNNKCYSVSIEGSGILTSDKKEELREKASTQPIFPKRLQDVNSVSEELICNPEFAEKGRQLVTITSTAEEFPTQAGLRVNFISASTLKESLEEYGQTNEIKNRLNRQQAIRKLFPVDGPSISISDAGPIKLVIHLENNQLIGATQGTVFPLQIAIENVDKGDVEQIEELTVTLPLGITVATDFESTKQAEAERQLETTGTVEEEELPARQASLCPWFSVEQDESGRTVLRLTNEYIKQIDFSKTKQQPVPRCFVEVVNPTALLDNPNRPNPRTITAKVVFDYTLEKDFEVKYGKKEKEVKLQAGDDYCPEVEKIDAYESKTPTAETTVNKHDKLIAEAAKKHGVCKALIKGVIDTESAGNQDATSFVGARGLMQLMPATAKGECDLTEAELKDPEKNIDCGTKYLAKLISQYDDDIVLGVAAYNAGYQVKDRVPDIPQTQAYVPKVIGSAKYFSEQAQEQAEFTGTGFDILPTSYSVSSCYGPRELGDGFHDGIDFETQTGSDVKVVADGTVYSTCNGWCYGFGSNVVVKHNNNLYTKYGHLHTIKVAKGETVKKGEIIALSGDTGYSTGPHLHFGVYKDAMLTQGSNTGENPACYLSTIQGCGCDAKTA